jgi:hypothetical protein
LEATGKRRLSAGRGISPDIFFFGLCGPIVVSVAGQEFFEKSHF